MSTKFNNAQKLQKTPKVCKKPPLALPPSLESFYGYPLQAYASWTNPFSPLDGSIAGLVALKPNPPGNLHFGRIQGDPHSLEIDLSWDPNQLEFLLVLTLLLGMTVIDSRSRTFSNPTPELPFAAGMFTWTNDGTTVYADCKILS